MHSLGSIHWKQAKCIFYFLSGTVRTRVLRCRDETVKDGRAWDMRFKSRWPRVNGIKTRAVKD